MKLIILLIMILSSLFASVDINKADAETLTNLNGIGPKKSKAIVAFRKKNGCFSKVEEITKVKGIGPKTLKKNRADMVLSKCDR